MAQEEAHHPEDHRYSFDSPFGTYDMAEVQRGFLFTNRSARPATRWTTSRIATSAKRAVRSRRYRVRNHETGEYEVQIGPPAHGGQLLDISDNPYVRSIAADAGGRTSIARLASASSVRAVRRIISAVRSPMNTPPARPMAARCRRICR